MKLNKLKKGLAFAMACTMVLTPLTAFAAEETTNPNSAQGSISGNGTVEGYVDKDVFSVVLPTVAEGSDVFNFILDPQGLIAATSAEKYGNGVTFEEGASLFFKNADKSYSSTSNSLKAVNKGTNDVDVTLNAVLTGLTGGTGDTAYTIGLSDSTTFKTADATDIYLAVTVSGNEAEPTPITSSEAKVTDALDPAPDEAYEVVYDEDAEAYAYQLTETASSVSYNGFDDIEFYLTGACNTDATADWTNVTDAKAAPHLEFSWTLEKHEEPTGPQVALASDGTITITGLTADQNYKSGTLSGTPGSYPLTTFITWDDSNYSSTEGGSLIAHLGKEWLNTYAGTTVTVTITLTDNSTITASVEF